MNLLLLETITGGGIAPADLPVSLLREGEAMVQAIASDLAMTAGIQLAIFRTPMLGTLEATDRSLPLIEIDSRETLEMKLRELGAAGAWLWLIAPESDGELLHFARLFTSAGGQLASPLPSSIALASSKHATAELLRSRGIPAIPGTQVLPGETIHLPHAGPVMLKPDDGCGSQGLRLLEAAAAREFRHRSTGALRAEPLYEGIAASVAVIAGPRGLTPLVPCTQQLAKDGSFVYLGGSLPIPEDLSSRAQLLALRAVEAVPEPRGYFGVDLLLDARPSESDQPRGDYVVEINPRLTTSYVGLRHRYRTNLAEATLLAVAGEQITLEERDVRVEFDSCGQVSIQEV